MFVLVSIVDDGYYTTTEPLPSQSQIWVSSDLRFLDEVVSNAWSPELI